MLLGVVIVLGACVALWWHHQQYKSVETDDEPDHALAFAQRQYNRRSITTTMIGVLGLLILDGDQCSSGSTSSSCLPTGLVMVIPLITSRYSVDTSLLQKHDQGVRRATHDLLENCSVSKRRCMRRRLESQGKLQVPRGECGRNQ